MVKFPNSKILIGLLLAGLLSPFAGCKCSKEDDELKALDPLIGDGETPDVRDTLSLLTPEQMSEQIYRVFGVRDGYTDNNGFFRDSLIENYGVALGGIDYEVASQRNPLPRVQTLLITRALSWNLTNRIASDAETATDGRFFAIADIYNDRPFRPEDGQKSDGEQASIRQGEARWQEQVEDMYWRLYGRAPSSAELELMRTAFLEAYVTNTYYTPMAWRLLIFSLISSLEFWSA